MGFLETVMIFFSGFSLLSAVMLLMGLSLIVIEMFRSSRRILGVSGWLLLLAGTTVRMLGGGTLITFFIISFLVSFVIFVAHIAALRFQKRGWLYQSLHLAVEAQKNGFETREYEFLVGLSGTAATDINRDGNMSLGDVNFLVRSEQCIRRGSSVRVTAVDGDKIYVTKEDEHVTGQTKNPVRSVDKAAYRTQNETPLRTIDKKRPLPPGDKNS